MCGPLQSTGSLLELLEGRVGVVRPWWEQGDKIEYRGRENPVEIRGSRWEQKVCEQVGLECGIKDSRG